MKEPAVILSIIAIVSLVCAPFFIAAAIILIPSLIALKLALAGGFLAILALASYHLASLFPVSE